MLRCARQVAFPAGTGPMSDPHCLFRLDGKVALVTGAASGLGRVIAEGFADVGAHVICADVSDELLAQTLDAIAASKGHASSLNVDVADAERVAKALSWVGAEFPAVDILVNCAGITAMPARTYELSIVDWTRLIAINLTGVFLVTRATLPLMLQGGGSIINIASVIGVGGYYPGFPSTGLHYAASKAGIIGLTRQLAMEYAADNIRANVIAPGWHFGTRLGDFRRTQMGAQEQARFMEEIIRRIPMGRTGEPSEIIGLALYLASPASGYVTGQLITQDGGWTAC